MGNCNQL